MTGYVYLGPGSVLEVPIRSDLLPVNIWQRTSSIDSTNSEPTGDSNETQGDWQRSPVQVDIAVAAGDTVLAAMATVTIAGAFRRKQGILDLGIFDTNDWGMAFDGVEPLTAPFIGPGILTLWGKMATSGYAWSGTASAIIDLFILRASLVSSDPPPFSSATPSAHRIFTSPFTRFDEVVTRYQLGG